MALDNYFVEWQKKISTKYNIYLEIQRGGRESQLAIQEKTPSIKPFYKENEFTNAFDLIKVFAAGWLGETGLAYNATPPFAPGGTIFDEIINNKKHKNKEREIQINDFDEDDLFAVWLLNYEAINKYRFGRGAEKNSARGFTRYLFYYTVIEIIRDFLNSIHKNIDTKLISKAILKLFSKPEEIHLILNNAALTIDEYFKQGNEYGFYKDEAFVKLNYDIVKILKMSELGKTKMFRDSIILNIRALKQISNGKVPYTEIMNTIKSV